jgi:hypothetical protein
MAFTCSIGVVTYLGRFESYFKPLMRKLHLLFPDYEINVWLNGHYDKKKQIQYLREVTTFLNKYHNIRYVTNFEHKPLANGYNWLILISKCNHVLILNDDIKLYSNFRHNLERLQSPPGIFTLNGTWSHFVISKNVVKKVGWFDERLLGIGYEDTDYAIRLAFIGIPLGDIKIHGLHNYMAPPDDASWANISGRTLGKYSQINREFFEKKWGIVTSDQVSGNDFIKIKAVGNEWVIRPNQDFEEVPEFYPLSCLKNPETSRHQPLGWRIWVAANLIKICSNVSSLYWGARLAVGVWVRKLLGPRWDQWKRIIK